MRQDQETIAKDPAKIKVLSMGRRYGKTVLGRRIVSEVLRKHGTVAWIAPNYKNTRPLWRAVMQATAADVKAKRMMVNRSDRTIETRRGGFLAVYSGDNIDSIRGESFHLVVADEAARLPEDAWTDAILPTLADHDGDAVLISTPKGRNWFWREWMAGQEGRPDIKSWQAPTSDNPLPNIQKAAELAKTRISDRTYRQEWLAEFVEDGGVFRDVHLAATATAHDTPQQGATYVGAIDWALSVDFTVFTIIDAATAQMVYVDRFNSIDYSLQRIRIAAACSKYNVTTVIGEANAMGKPNNDELRRMGVRVRDFTTSNATKAHIIEQLAAAFEQGNLRILPNATLIAELQSYEAERLASGAVRYSAPDGLHDDMVMSLALAWNAARSGRPARSRQG